MMNRRLFRGAAFLQLVLAVVFSTGCTPTQPFFLNESPNLQYYLDTATSIEYPDADVASLADTTEAKRPLTIGNHDFEYWDLTLEECVSIALANAKFFKTVAGTAEERQNIAAQFVSGQSAQFGSTYDVAIQQTTTQSIPLTIDGNGNRVLPRGAARANQVGGVEDALAEFDAQASSFFNLSTTDRVRNVGPGNVFNPQQFQAFDSTQQSAISKRMATGGVVTLREQVLYSRNNIQTNDVGRQVGSDYTTLIEAQVQHPLMRNRGTLINRIPVILASLNEDTTLAEFESQVRNLAYDVERDYWDLYTAFRSVETAMIGRNSAQATARFAELNLESGTGTVQDVAQAEGQYYQFRARLEAALAGANVPGVDRQGVYGSERALREKMGLAPTDGRLIRPIDEPSKARVMFDWDDAIVEMLHLSPELRQTKTEVKKRELELMSAKNQLLPEVNLSLLYRWVGVGDELGLADHSDAPAPNRGSSALDELTSGNFQEAAVRLEITPPAFGARRALARVRNTQLQLAREKAFLQEQELMLVSQLSDAISKLETHYQLIQTTAQQLAAADKEVNARLAEYRGGRSQINVVLQSQSRRAEAQISYYQALTAYNKSISYVHFLKGSLLNLNGISLGEGPWPKKAYWDALERARERSAGKQLQYGVTRPGVVRRGPVPSALPNQHPEMTAPAPELVPMGESIILDEPVGSGLGEPSGEITIPAGSGLTPAPNLDQLPSEPEPLPAPGAAEAAASGRSASFVAPASHLEAGAPKPVRRRALPSHLH